MMKIITFLISLSFSLLASASDSLGKFAGSREASDDGFCLTCYEENYKIFVHNLECKKGKSCLGKLAEEVEQKGFLSPVKKRKLKRKGPFYESRVGVLIHEQCFEKGLFDFDVESAVSETYIKGMAGVLELFEAAEFLDQENGGASYQIHIPGIVREFDRSLWKSEENVGETFFKNNFKQQVYSQKKACETLKTLGLMVQGKECNFHPEIPAMQNKIFCQRDFLSEYGDITRGVDASRNIMSASGVYNKIPAIIQWSGKTQVYSYPYIAVRPEIVKSKWQVKLTTTTNNQTYTTRSKPEKSNRGRFMSFLWHENGHVIGQKHNNDGEIEVEKYNEHPDYPVFCQVAFFWEEHAKNILTREDLEYSLQQCINAGKSDAEINRKANWYRNLL